MLTFGIIIGIGSLCIYASNSIESLSVAVSPTQLQVIPNWQTIPYVELEVVDADVGCSENFEPAF